jgi:nucleotide-binding universal stress UspA family protein
MNNIILVPTDFSEVCQNAAHQAAEAARLLNYKLLLLHIINKDTRAYLKSQDLDLTAVDTKLEAEARELRLAYAIEVETKSIEGSIFTTIGEVAKDTGAALLYLGTHGKAGIQHLTGSYALKVITSSPVPVIVVQKRKSDLYRNIVLPITSEAGPWEKTKWAVFISRTFDATVHLYQIDTPSKEIEAATLLIAQYLEKNGVPHTLKVSERSNSFSRQVIDYATSLSADMIMIMTNPDRSFTTFLLGTYDEEMMFNTSQIPVMCVNPRKFSYEILGL